MICRRVQRCTVAIAGMTAANMGLRFGPRSAVHRIDVVGVPRCRSGIRLAIIIRIDDAIVMFSVLIIIFGSDSVASRCGITSEGQIFFKYLISIAPDANVWTIAIEGLMAKRNRFALATATALTTPAVHSAAITLTVTAPARPLHMGTLSHGTFYMTGIDTGCAQSSQLTELPLCSSA